MANGSNEELAHTRVTASQYSFGLELIFDVYLSYSLVYKICHKLVANARLNLDGNVWCMAV